MRIDTLSHNNLQTQGAQRRTWLRQHAPQHLEQCSTVVMHALSRRPAAVSQSSLVLGAGACTEVPLATLCRASEEVVLVDLDLGSMQRGRDELPTSLQKRLRLVQADLSGGVSQQLTRLLRRQSWDKLVSQGAYAVFDAAAQCLEKCPIPDPPVLPDLSSGDFGLVVSSLVLSQLFSYPLLDALDFVQNMAPAFLGEQERHRRYQESAQTFRLRIINAHLHLLRNLLDMDGIAVLLSDIRGFAFNVYGTDHDAQHRRVLPLMPRIFPELVRDNFTVLEEARWEWVSDLPENERPGRGFEAVGYILGKCIK